MSAPEVQSRITQYFRTFQHPPESTTRGEPSNSASAHIVGHTLVTLKDKNHGCPSLPTPSPSPPRFRQPLSHLSSNVRSSPANAAEEQTPAPNVPVAYIYPGQTGHQTQHVFKQQGPLGSRKRLGKQPVRHKRTIADLDGEQVPFAQQHPRPAKRACRLHPAKALAPSVYSNSLPLNAPDHTLPPLQNNTWTSSSTSTSTNMELTWTLPGIGFIKSLIGASPAAPIDLTQDEEPDLLPLPIVTPLPAPFQAPLQPLLTAGPTSAPASRGQAKVKPTHRPAQKHFKGVSAVHRRPISHRNLGVFKLRHFEELNMGNELFIAQQTGSRFDPSQLNTIILAQYLKQSALTGRDTVLAGRKKSKSICGGYPGGFPGIVEMMEPIAAVKKAYEEHTPVKIDRSRLVLWTDASLARGGCGFAVVYRESTSHHTWTEWNTNGFSVHGWSSHSDVLEAIGVIKACEIIIRKATSSPGQYRSASIYSDSLNFLREVTRNQKVQRPSKSQWHNLLIPKVIRMANKIRKQLKIQISLHWVPGHSQVPGNHLADRIAGIAAGHRVHPGAKVTIELSDGEGDEQESDEWESDEEGSDEEEPDKKEQGEGLGSNTRTQTNMRPVDGLNVY